MSETKEAREALEVAKESVAIAKELNEDTREQLRQTREMHEMMLTNQRRVCMAFSSLLPQPIRIEFTAPMTSENIKDEAQQISKAIANRDIYDVIHAINVLAMSNGDVLQLFTSFDGNTQSLRVWAVDVNTDWSAECSPKRLLNECVYLDHEFALKELLYVESQLTELVIEAREASETKAGEA
ncbi:hypothetical protein [Vibrio aestuarianus]|uniref:Uncharacterized protein n=1 Tax=Vibrio aestuarianus TaxID=28171 RepID=A0ABM9FR94_9VIBR|nr:hypothetical protein [Vibrio aestuarianus]MDE1213790.1 hypothetical protein [Vibrio aestuarianus]MDE1217247.1 hypothetical protein [Vibrio aestuarianus]MDE1256988.1 hypothetical protein [Vibrio aestuarianus]MDE1260788.1 hypothetical protein [Vibrio aestuarianus]MDE1267584.1 hypothetical protein [Vibrio aestuarianus]